MTATRDNRLMTGKAASALLLVTLLLATPFTLTPAAALECPDGRLVTNDDTGARFCSLQVAIDAAGPGDTLLVSPGTYAEAVTVPAGRDGLVIAGTEPRAATIALPNAGDMVNVRSDDVLLHGLVIRNAAGGAAVMARADGLVLRENLIDGRLSVPDGLGVLDVDARLNQWGVARFADVLERVHAPGGRALAAPFLLMDGTQDPPAPTVSAASHCSGVGFAPRFIEEAIWCAHPGETIALHPSNATGTPTPYQPTPDGFFGSPAGNLVFKNRGISGTTFGEPDWGTAFNPVAGHGGEFLDGLTICSGPPVTSGQDPPAPSPGGPCANDPAGVVVDPLGGTSSALDVRAASVVVSALTIKNTGDADDLDGLVVRAADAIVRGNVVAGNFLPIEHDGGPTIDQIGVTLLTAASSGATVEDNVIQNWRNIGLYLSNSAGDASVIVGNTVSQNRWTGILLEGPNGGTLDVRDNLVEQSGDSAIRFGADDASGWRVRQNTLAASNLFGVSVQSGTTGTVIDVRLNNWGIDSYRVIADRVDDESGTNTVLQLPYLRADGGAEPALPRGPDVPAAACDAHPDAEFVAGHCRYFTVQAALDLAVADEAVFLGGSTASSDPTPYLGSIDMDLGLGGAALTGVAVCGSTGGLLCALDHEPAHYELRDLAFDSPPIAFQGKALTGTSGGGATFSHSLFPAAGLQVNDITALRYDIFAATGVCSAGNGRISLGIDVDGDGTRDGNVEVDAAKACPNGEWTTIDFFDGLATTWTGGAFGIPSGSQGDAHDAVEAIANANGVSHEVVAVNVQFDAATPTTAWLDNIQLNGFLLGEQNDIDCWFAQGANCRQDAVTAATVIQSDSGVRVAELDQDDQTLRGLTVRRTGDPGSHAYGVRVTGDRGTLDTVRVLMQGGGCSAGGACGEPANVTALDVAGADAVVRDSYIAADLFSTETGVFGGVNGAVGNMDGALIEGNLFRAWRANHVFPFGDDVTVRSNTFESIGSTGVLVCSNNDDVLVQANVFQGLSQAVAVCGATAPTDLVVNDNTMGLTNRLGLQIRDPTIGAFVNAECNDWGVYHMDGIEAGRIADENDPSTNVVDASPFTSPDAGGIQCLLGPTAAFTASPTTTDRRTVVEFQDTSTAGSRPIVSWQWDFGDGTTSLLPIVNHTYETVGTFIVTLVVTDAQGMRSSATETIVVENLAPLFPAIPDLNVQEFGTLTVPLVAKDMDGDNPVTFVLAQGPAGATVVNHGNGSGTFEWTAGASTIETVSIRAEDSHASPASETRTFDIVVGTGFDIAPVLDPIVDQAVQETQNLVFSITGSDADGDPLTLDVAPLPAGASLTQTGPTTWSFDWTPSLSQQGTYALTATLSDGQLVDTQLFTIVVANLDQPPLIDSFPGLQHVPNAATQAWYVRIVDPDPEPITFTASGLPGGGAISDNGQGLARIDWPARPTGSTATICVTASSAGVSVAECFDVRVTGWVDLDVQGLNGPFVDAAPGGVVTLEARVRNLGTSPAVVAFATESDKQWATTAPASMVLFGGEAVDVSFQVTAGTVGSQSRIEFTASTSSNPGEAESLYWRVYVPVLMDVEIVQRDGVRPVEGIVTATFVDGSPAANVPITVTDRPEGALRESLTSVVTGRTAADGTFAFSFGADSLSPGGHVLGNHELTVEAVRDGRVDTVVTEYVVGLV